MDLENVKLSLVKYRIDTLKLTIPTIKQPYSIENSFISNMVIEKDFDNFYFPYFEITVSVPTYIYRAMVKNNLDIYAYIDLQRGYFKDVEIGKEDPKFSTYLKDTFYVFMENMTPDASESTSKEIEEANGTYNKGTSLSELTTVKLLLYNKNYLFNSKTIVNDILTSASLVDALTFTLNEAGLKKVLVTPPSSYKSYSEFIITPVTAMEQLERICNGYGMHTNGTLIFFDLSLLYIIDRSPKCSAYQQNEFKITHLMSMANHTPTLSQEKGCYKSAADKYNIINLEAGNVQFKSLGELNNQVYGNSFITVNSNTGAVSNTKSKAASAKASLSTPSRVIIQDGGGSTSKALANSLKEDSRIAILGFSYVDLDMLSPNKQFVITMDDSKLKKYNGKYRITKLTTNFDKEGLYFIPQTVAEFKG